MIFVEWAAVGLVLAGLLITLLSAVAFWQVRCRRLLLRLPVQIFAVPAGLLGASFSLLLLGISGCQSYSAPIFSPDGQSAARVCDSHQGALGGDTMVELFTAHGFKTEVVFAGGLKSVEPGQIHWMSNSELSISYSRGSERCASTRSIKVSCIRTDTRP